MTGEPWLAEEEAGAFRLWGDGTAAVLAAAATESPVVLRALGDLALDWKRVAGTAPRRVEVPDPGTPTLLVGTAAGNPLIAAWAAEGRLDLTPLAGAWEASLTARVGEVLCVVGSDPRGAVFAVYRLAEALGVSPWHWWSRTPVAVRPRAWLDPGPRFYPGPRVKYRGSFLNDEYPNLTRWVAERWGETSAGAALYGREFYALVFELLLRLGGNTLWPAMWNNAFYEDDPGNQALAREFGVVLGTSHQEPMGRAQKEWDRRHASTLGSWDWSRHREELVRFWRQGIRRVKGDEVLLTIGLRGADDTEMSQADPEDCVRMLEEIVRVQRTLVAEEKAAAPETVPQVWCLYKEVLDYCRRGLRVPDDVTLLWPDDNWGALRRVPDAAERRRSGGAGIYYHLDYHGGPRSYQWVHTTPLGKISDQMALAAQYGADRLWMVNVGHLKGYELALEYFLRLGWAPGEPRAGEVRAWTVRWAAREFGEEFAAEAAEILSLYGLYNGRRKPELLSPDTFSLVHYHESERVTGEYAALAARAQALGARLPEDRRQTFYQTVEFPVTACALVYRLYAAAARHQTARSQGRASTGFWEAETRRLFAEDLALMEAYNRRFAGGAWNHFMDQTHLGYTSWNDPPVNSLDAIALGSPPVPSGLRPGMAFEGGEAPLRLDAFRRPRRWIDLFRRGDQEFSYQVSLSRPWLRVSSAQGTVGDDVRLWLDADWGAVPRGLHREVASITAGGQVFLVPVEVFRPDVSAPDLAGRWIETDGVVAIEAVHGVPGQDSGEGEWQTVEELGPRGSAVRAWAPADAAFEPGQGPFLDYRVYLFSGGKAILNLELAPTLNAFEGRGVRWAWSWNHGPAHLVEAVPADFEAMHHNQDWEKTVADGVRHSRAELSVAPGPGLLRVWMVDPGVVVYRIVLDLGGLRPSYLGPPESPQGPG